MNYGFAYSTTGTSDGRGGWAQAANGQIQRAGSIEDKVRRLLRPLWGAVWSEPERGNARQTKAVDALNVIIADRARLVLNPLIAGSEISELSVEVVAHPTNAQRRAVRIEFRDSQRQPHKLTLFVRVP